MPDTPRTTIHLDRFLSAPPDRVFAAATDPAEMARWMWAGIGTDAWATCDLRVGGAWQVYTKAPGGKHRGADWSGMRGVLVVVEPGRALTYTLHWDADVGYNQGDRLVLDEVVAMVFAAEGDGTRLCIAHHGIPDDGVSPEGHRAGMSASLDCLAGVLG